MTRDGEVSTVLDEVDGQRLTSANFVFYDRSPVPGLPMSHWR
jgi:hypothetical protein